MLFSTLTEIQQHIAVGNGTDFNRLKPHILNAETAYICPLLGTEMFAKLQEFFDNPPSAELAEEQKIIGELLKKVQKSLIHLAYWMGFQVLNATISDGGFKRSENEKMKSLFKYQEDELKEYFKNAGFNALDEVLEYLEGNMEQFSDFKTSANWTILKSAFIPDTKTFDSIIFINSSRLTFLRLKSFSGLVEDLSIKPILGEAIFTEIKTEMVKVEVPAKVKNILPYIRKAVAYLSASRLMEESGSDLTEKGLYFESTSAGFKNDRSKQPSNPEQVAALAARYRAIGESYLEQLKSYLIAHPQDWPGYSGQPGNVLRRNNTNRKTFWA
ncbi:MAG TPA: hypothetical protein DHV48_10500 [Prolixibacteraceae bacterium]|nr:hypothetical protein [Prolixibacteraceae bacterium]